VDQIGKYNGAYGILQLRAWGYGLRIGSPTFSSFDFGVLGIHPTVFPPKWNTSQQILSMCVVIEGISSEISFLIRFLFFLAL
jgi:hypothetical protein